MERNVLQSSGRILLSHGGGGKLTQDLIAEHIAPALSNSYLDEFDDGARFTAPAGKLAFTTDSFVVSPTVFPGGDIGKIAVIGTVNDLLVSGAKPLYLSLGLILEEGLPINFLDRIVSSIALAAKQCGVRIVTGDTKVVEHGKCDELFINTSGVGQVAPGYANADRTISPGDKIIVSGTMGDHGGVLLATRSNLNLAGDLISDCAPVTDFVDGLLSNHIFPKFMRDPTRGGLAGVLCDIAQAGNLQVVTDRAAIPIHPDVATIEDILGIDPLHMACEGRVVSVVSKEHASKALELWKKCPGGQDAAIVGEIEEGPARVIMQTEAGSRRLLHRPSGDLLPRIC